MSSYYSPKGFTGFVGAESTVGSTPTGTDVFRAIEADSLPTITYNDLKTTEKRANSGLGRLLNSGDIQSHEPGAVHEFSASGVLTTELADILIPNSLGIAFANGVATIPSKHSPNAYSHADTSSGAHQSITCGISGSTVVGADNDVFLSGCVIDSLTLSADANENGGRFNFDFGAKSRVSASADFSNVSANIGDYSENYLYLSDCTTAKLNGNATIIDSFSLTIENPVSFQGNKKVVNDQGLPEKYLRSVPTLKITGSMTVKYDTTTDGLIASSKNLTVLGQESLSFLNLSSDDTAVGETAFDATTGFGFSIPAAIVTEATRDESDYMRLNLSFEVVDRATAASEFFQILRG